MDVTANGQFIVDLSSFTSGPVTSTLFITDAAANTATVTGTAFEVICFLAGTAIATPEGERAIETLAIGDLVLTAEGRAAPVRWVGRQTVA
ncbi:MAG TPA: Hint domain-containing protein, partial [Crenalkalicoccus sp.]|nr:Hint domain-containing protein [Crenalkalicoccus sp.]